MYSKKSTNWYAVPVKVPKTYYYIVEMQTEIVKRRMADKEPIGRHIGMLPDDPRRIKKTLAPSSPPPTAELVRRHHSRMAKQQGDSG